jgi:phage shock protein PspC (stress-responsive transcriptional regulator)
MKKVININFQGRVIPIEESAYDILKQYVESLRNFFANEEGRDEIINDIEGRIAELFGETLKKGSTCITDDDVNAVIASIGKPEDFEGEETNVKSQLGGESKQQQSTQSETFSSSGPKRLFRDENGKIVAGVCSGIANYFGIDPLIIRILFVIFAFGFGFGFITYLVLWVAVPSTSAKVIGSAKKRLLRDPDDKIIAGVCRGLSHYFGVNVWIPRVLFLIPFVSIIFRWVHLAMFPLSFPHFISVSFSPGATLLYIILWLVLPEAQSTSDKLEMKGEKVDLNSIKNTVVSDIKDFKERIPQMAQDVHDTIPKKAKEFSEFAQQKSRSGLGNVIALLVKIVVYFIVGVIIFSIVSALFALGVAGTGLLPLKHYLINDGWESAYAWGVLILFIWIPVIGIIVWIIRRIAKIRSNSNVMRYGFSALWIVGLFCVFALIFSLRDDFKYHNYPIEQNVPLANPTVNKLEVKGNVYLKYYGNNTWLHLEPFANIDADTVYVRNIEVRIIKSNSDSFKITTLKISNGASRQQAEDLVSKINFNIVQQDSSLFLDRGIAITAKEKFRNQKIYITIAVPVGKRIQVGENIGEYNEHVDFGWDMNDWDWEREYDNSGDYSWDRGVEYIMTKTGLERTDGKKENVDNDDENDNSSICRK